MWSSGQRTTLLLPDDPSSNPDKVYSFSVKTCFGNKQNDAGVGPIIYKNYYYFELYVFW